MKTKLLLLLIIPMLFSCGKKDEPNLPKEVETKYYILDFKNISKMVGTNYDDNATLLKDYKINEKSSVGVRIGEYFLKDKDNIIMKMTVKENSSKKVSGINIMTSYLKYSREEQLDIYIKHLQIANNEIIFTNANYENTYGSISIAESVSDIIKKLQDNSLLRKDHTILCNFKNENTTVNAFFIANTYSIDFK